MGIFFLFSFAFPFSSFHSSNSCGKKKNREVKNKGEKERYTHFNAGFPRIARRDKKAFLSDQCKEIKEKKIE